MTLRSLVAVLLLTLAVPACDHASADGPAQRPATDPNAIHECPMHCVKPGETAPYTHRGPGACPVCGMDLVPQAPANAPSKAPAPH